MKVLVTGATGFLGSHLVKALLHQNHEVIIVKRSFSNTWRIDDVLQHLISYDLDHNPIEKIFDENRGIEAIIHTATSYGRQGESRKDVFETNLEFPLQMIKIASKYGAKFFFNTDTFFGKLRYGNYNYLSDYTISKKQFREQGERMALSGKVKFINVRLEHVYGPFDDDSKFVNQIIKRCLSNVECIKLTKGEQKRDFIYVDDVVSAYLLLMDKADQLLDSQEFEVGTGNMISIREFVETVCRVTHSNTILKFGALPYRENEIMESYANNQPLIDLGWKYNIRIQEGILRIVQTIKPKPA